MQATFVIIFLALTIHLVQCHPIIRSTSTKGNFNCEGLEQFYKISRQLSAKVCSNGNQRSDETVRLTIKML